MISFSRSEEGLFVAIGSRKLASRHEYTGLHPVLGCYALSGLGKSVELISHKKTIKVLKTFIVCANNNLLCYDFTGVLITPNSFPTFSKAANALSKCSFSCAAESCTRIRA
jgi:hypothetical protein